MRIEEFDYPLPASLIAQYPSPQRGESRLMALDRAHETIEHRSFSDLPGFLEREDLIVMNDSRVLPARLIGKKATGGRCEVLLIPPANGRNGKWDSLIKGVVKAGASIQFGEGVSGKIEAIRKGKARISFPGQGEVLEIIQRIGHIPLPPYIKREDEPLDRDRYQTVYAERNGSIAAPTAGLHFTGTMLQALKERGVRTAFLTLHVGIGTFAPVKAANPQEHRMEAETIEIPEETAALIHESKAKGKRVIAVGTTTTRALESFCDPRGRVKAGKGSSSLFICPPYRLRVIDGLLTNFHLPKSTLILLVSAFAGREFILRAYEEAVEKRYRFYSYGDAMLIL
jgi:S-adenosylmethionine:tRNA ribosyltransferase-isomerase